MKIGDPPTVIPPMIYLFIGEDELKKTEKIHSLKKQLFNSQVESFNYEAFYAQELNLPLFKEVLSSVPVSAKNRLLVIKDALKLKDNLQEYFLGQIKDLPASLTVILDVAVIPKEENLFLNKILKIARAVYFKTRESVNAFGLARAVERRQPDQALNILVDLFKAGEKPERILGALRYQLISRGLNPQDRIKKINLLLETDVNLKTGKLRPEFALEALVVRLCR